MANTAFLRAQVARWRGTGGPTEWERAWDRALNETTPVYAQEHEGNDDHVFRLARLAEGTAGLALAYYLLASTSGTPVEEVSTGSVRMLAALPPDTEDLRPAIGRIDALVARAGHDLDDPRDPVTACWRDLRKDCSPPAYGIYNDLALAIGPWRWGSDQVVSLAFVLDLLPTEGTR